jgi:hypothetical protein
VIFIFVFSFAFFNDAFILDFRSSRFAFAAACSSGVRLRPAMNVLAGAATPESSAWVLAVLAHPADAPVEAPAVAALQDIGMLVRVDSIDA